MSYKLVVFILINIIIQVYGHQLIINCINGCKNIYNHEYLCRNFIDDSYKYNNCKDDILISFNNCSNMCANYYYTYRDCIEFCNHYNIPSNCNALIK